ncbi:hypothetical protein OKW21_002092 [Catalinimonas alkaloidigena]|uniref:hypothetical protein n=1 Tax=Catalinimonas alkaloidigena TaxID=1075417 RepID=UPI002405B7AA|nr:hypothetical protein [Catalinimonas alkaloidigena]MDF9796829.1 hypothetical protein [Catalinimonas alkaloidigena]
MIFQIKLKSITIIENGKVSEGEGNNLLSMSLIYPNPQMQAPTTVMEVQLQDNKTLDLAGIPLKDQVIFKGPIVGESGIDVEISAIEKQDKIAALLHRVFGQAVNGALNLIPGGGVVSLITSAARNTLASVFDQTAPKERLHKIGKGYMSLHKNTPEGDFVVQLSVPEEVKLIQSFINEQGQRATKTITLPKGFANAMVVFDIKKFPLSQGSGSEGMIA